MRTKISFGLLITFVLLLMVIGTTLPSTTHGEDKVKKDDRGKTSTKEVYTGTAVDIGRGAAGRSRSFTLEITSHTADQDAQRDQEVLQTQGQDALMKAIGKQKLGYFSFEGQLGRDLNYVQETDTEDGRKIVILFERWLKMFEVRNGTRSEDYPFTYIELFIDNNGKGEGSMIGAAKASMDKRHLGTLDVENFGTFPAKLMGVELRK